ncbi:MAG TPA: helix-turn-helix domain-containing protein [Gemmatimonadaceae bacterium]|jgi:DNA-binding GntR family transcriptional regulator
MAIDAIARPTLDPYVVDTLMPDLVGHDRRPSAFLVYLYLWRQTNGGRSRSDEIPLRMIAEGTGVSKRAVQNALRALARRRLVTVAHATSTSAPTFLVHRPWARR